MCCICILETTAMSSMMSSVSSVMSSTTGSSVEGELSG